MNQSGNRYLTAKERAMNAEAIAAQERLNAQQERLAKEEAQQKAQRLAERLRALEHQAPMNCKGLQNQSGGHHR
jgi:ferritin-like protein